MNFKFKSISMLISAMVLGLASCQNEALLPNNAENTANPAYSGKTVFLTAGVALPTDGTRSATDDYPDPDTGETNSNESPDFEYGYDYENDVRTMLLVFATTDNKFLCSTVVSGIEKAPTGLANYTFEVAAELKYDDLAKLYETKDGNKGLLASDDSDNPTAPEINVYAYCNYTANLEKLFEDTEVGSTAWIDYKGTVSEEPSAPGHTPSISSTIWAERSFLMTNYQKATTKFPATLAAWEPYADKSNPYQITSDGKQEGTPLSAIKVERSAARIDFRDGSKDMEDPAKGDYEYKIITDIHVHVDNSDDPDKDDEQINDELNLFNVKLSRMALVNMSKEFYYLRRVSDNGFNTNANLLGAERTTNYVVDTDADKKQIANGHSHYTNFATNYTDYTKAFNFPLYKSDDSYNKAAWYADEIDDVLDNRKDTWTGNRYHIWRYVTENTIPGEENQITAQSVGVVFKGRIKAGEDIEKKYSTSEALGASDYYVSENVRKALADDNSTYFPVLYSFDGFLYAGFEELIEKAATFDGKGGRLYMAVEAILSNLLKLESDESTNYTSNGTGEGITLERYYKILNNEETGYTIANNVVTEAAVKELAPKNRISVYEASDEDDGEGKAYYCYYFYWNRHNDNSKSGLMGKMEFATVRNNVYKLAVTKINQFGHPIEKKNDWDPVDKDDPDEEPLRYIEVKVEVLPWVVRVNNIEF